MKRREDGWYGYQRCEFCGARMRQRQIEPLGAGVHIRLAPDWAVDCSQFMVEHGGGEALFIAYDRPEDFAAGGDGWVPRFDRWLAGLHAYEAAR